ncbi:hypothetical protein TRSA_15120 [Treponema saccharophilum]|nr:hypothetical protein TRSA_15120 [Treponema saccharophilum]
MRPAHRRTLAPSKPNSERATVLAFGTRNVSGTHRTPARKMRPAHRRTLAPTKPNSEHATVLAFRTRNVSGTHRTPGMEDAPRASAHACSNQAELRTRKRPSIRNTQRPGHTSHPRHGRCAPRIGARLLQPSRTQNAQTTNSEHATAQAHIAPQAWKMRPAHRRTLAPTKPNSERANDQAFRTRNVPGTHRTPGMEDAPRASAHACSNQAELRTRNCPSIQNAQRLGHTSHPRHGRCAPRIGARLLQPSRTQNAQLS